MHFILCIYFEKVIGIAFSVVKINRIKVNIIYRLCFCFIVNCFSAKNICFICPCKILAVTFFLESMAILSYFHRHTIGIVCETTSSLL